MSLDLSHIINRIREYVRKFYEREQLTDEAIDMLTNGPVNYCLRKAQELSESPEQVKTHFINCLLDVAAVIVKTTEEVGQRFSEIISEREVKKALKMVYNSFAR